MSKFLVYKFNRFTRNFILIGSLISTHTIFKVNVTARSRLKFTLLQYSKQFSYAFESAITLTEFYGTGNKLKVVGRSKVK